MFYTTSKTEGEVGPVKLTPSNLLLTVPRRSFCCGSLLPVFGVRVLVTFHLTCFHTIFSSVLVAEWTPFGKYLSILWTICFLCILTICNISYSLVWF